VIARGLAIAIAIASAAMACAPAHAAAQAAKPQQRPQPQPQQPRPAQPRRVPAVDATFQAWDADHNGVLSQAEFRQGWNSVRQRAEDKVEASLRTQFDKVDANHDGAIDGDEYGHLVLVQRAGKSAPPLAGFDRNGDQRIGFDEYLALVAKLAAAPHAQKGKAP